MQSTAGEEETEEAPQPHVPDIVMKDPSGAAAEHFHSMGEGWLATETAHGSNEDS